MHSNIVHITPTDCWSETISIPFACFLTSHRSKVDILMKVSKMNCNDAFLKFNAFFYAMVWKQWKSKCVQPFESNSNSFQEHNEEWGDWISVVLYNFGRTLITSFTSFFSSSNSLHAICFQNNGLQRIHDYTFFYFIWKKNSHIFHGSRVLIDFLTLQWHAIDTVQQKQWSFYSWLKKHFFWHRMWNMCKM